MMKSLIRAELLKTFDELSEQGQKDALSYIKSLASRPKIDLKFIFSVVEARGYTRSKDVPSLTDLLVKKIRKYHA